MTPELQKKLDAIEIFDYFITVRETYDVHYHYTSEKPLSADEIRRIDASEWDEVGCRTFSDGVILEISDEKGNVIYALD